MEWLRSTAFFIGASVSMVVIALLGLATAPLPFGPRYWFLTRWGRFAVWWLKVTCALDYEVEGRAHIPSGPAIILCKHQSTWETLVLQAVFPPQVWVLKRELMWIPLFGWGLALLRPIAIDRQAGRRAMEQIVTQGRERLESGLWVAVFPEGTRVPPGQRKKWGAGGAMLAAASGYPVVPVAHDAGYYWPRRGFLKRPGTIRMTIGRPIASAGRSAAEINSEAETWVNEQMRLLDMAQQKTSWADAININKIN